MHDRFAGGAGVEIEVCRRVVQVCIRRCRRCAGGAGVLNAGAGCCVLQQVLQEEVLGADGKV